MPIYRRKPTFVEAFQFDVLNPRLSEEWPDWFRKAMTQPKGSADSVDFGMSDGNIHFIIYGPEGSRRINHNDYVFMNALGEISCCSEEIFFRNYEFVETKEQGYETET